MDAVSIQVATNMTGIVVSSRTVGGELRWECPHPCHICARTGGKLRSQAVSHGTRTASDLGTRRLTPCLKRPFKQSVTLRQL